MRVDQSVSLPVNSPSTVERSVARASDSDSVTGGLPGTRTLLQLLTDVDRCQTGPLTAINPLRLHLVHVPDTVNLDKESWHCIIDTLEAPALAFR